MAATVWRGFVSFGLVSFPVRLQAAARDKSIHFHLLHKKDMSRIKEVYYCLKEDVALERKDLVKGFEVAENEYIALEQAELDKIAPKTAKVMDILEFVKATEVDPVYMDKSYYMIPDSDMTKPYALLLAAMKKRGQYAIAKVAMHNREYVVLIRPDGNQLILHTMFFANEVQQAEAKIGRGEFSGKELELAGQLIDTLTAKFDPGKFHDEYEANVKRLIERKQKGETFTVARVAKHPPVVNIVDALRKSLAEKNLPAKVRKRPAA